MSYEDNIDDLVTIRDEWIEEFGISWGIGSGSYIYDEMTQLEKTELKKLDEQKLVWTNASTCDGEYFMPGMLEFDGDSGCGCWMTYSFYVAKKAWTDEHGYVTAVTNIPCPVCNADRDGDGVEGCEGPAELPETEYGLDIGEGCENGWIQVYLD